MNVVHVITQLERAGAQGVLLRILRHSLVAKSGHVVVSLRAGGTVANDLREHGIEIIELGMTPGRPSPRAFRDLVSIIRSRSSDLVQTWLYHADLLGGLAARLARRPVVWNLRHSNLDRATLRRSTIAIARASAPLSHVVPARIIACSESARDAHVEIGYDASRMVVIPNGFDTNVFTPDAEARQRFRSELGIHDDRTTLIGHVGRFNPQKDHPTLLRALAMVPDAEFALCGEGVTAESAELSDLVASEGLSARTHLLGTRSDMPAFMAGIDLLVMSSASGEGFPNVLGEAMASSTACVTTDVGDAALIVGNTGRVVPPRDPSALATAINELVAMDTESLGRQARDRILDRYRLDNTVSRYLEVWESVAGPSR